jgi:hypothetical protein
LPGLSDPGMRAIVRKNILKPIKHIESVKDINNDENINHIVPIFIGAAAMALIIVLLVLVLVVMYYRNYRR